MKKREAYKVLPFILTSLIILAACGNEALPEEMNEMPSITGSLPTVEYAETTTTAPPPETTAAPTGPDMTGTELATTFTDENGNIYGKPPEDTEPSSDTAVTTSAPPDVALSDYYLHTDPANTSSSVTAAPVSEVSIETTSTTAPTAVSIETATTPSETAAAVTKPSSVTKPWYEQTNTSADTESSYFVDEPEIITSPTDITVTASDPLLIGDENAYRIEARNAKVPSKYTDADVVMHTNSYYFLSENERYCYDVIVDAMLNYEKSVTFPISRKITFDDLFNAYQCIYTDEVRLYYIDTLIEYVTDTSTGYIKTMRLSYIYTENQYRTMQEKLDARADEILSKITSDMTDYDIVKLIHDEIITSCTYTVEGSDDIISVYGALIDGKAQCQGYSRAFSYLTQLCGIETDLVLGIASEEHMWNMVKLDDKWYHIDLTWDDPDKEKYPDSVRYDYFCITTKRIESLRTIEGNTHKIPEATDETYDYFKKNNLEVSSYEEAKAVIISQAKELSRTKSSTIQFRCSDEGVYEEVYNALFTDNISGNAISILDEANESVTNKFSTNMIYHNSNASTLTIKIFLDYE